MTTETKELLEIISSASDANKAALTALEIIAEYLSLKSEPKAS